MPAGRPKKLTIKQTKEKKAEFIQALEKNMGIISLTLKQTNLTRWFYDQWRAEDPVFKKECEKVNDITLDFVESKLLKNIADGDNTAILFYLKCKGKERGYIEKQYIEQNTTFTEPLRINVIVPTPEQVKIEGEEQKKLDK